MIRVRAEWRRDGEKCSRRSTYAKVKGKLMRERYLDRLRGEERRGVLDLRGEPMTGRLIVVDRKETQSGEEGVRGGC